MKFILLIINKIKNNQKYTTNLIDIIVYLNIVI